MEKKVHVVISYSDEGAIKSIKMISSDPFIAEVMALGWSHTNKSKYVVEKRDLRETEDDIGPLQIHAYRMGLEILEKSLPKDCTALFNENLGLTNTQIELICRRLTTLKY